MPDGKTCRQEKLVVKTDLLRLMRLAIRGTFDMSIKNNDHEKGKLRHHKKQITANLLGNLSNLNNHLQMINQWSA